MAGYSRRQGIAREKGMGRIASQADRIRCGKIVESRDEKDDGIADLRLGKIVGEWSEWSE